VTLPAGWRLRLDPAHRRIDGGRVLVGGAPLRLLRLSEAGAKAVDQWAAGEEVGSSAGHQRLARRLLDVGLAHPVPGPTELRAARDVAAVIPVHPDASELGMSLRGLGPIAACTVVDDATGDPEVAATAKAHGAACEVRTVNGGPGAARNTGWRASPPVEVLAFLDPSCTPDPGWIDALLPHFDDPAVVAVAPRIRTRVEGDLPPTLQRYEEVRPSLDRGPQESAVRPRTRVPFVPTAALLVRRTAFEEVGGFDERLRYGEDVDLVWRLVEAGGTVRYEPRTSVAHGSRRTTRAWLRQRFAYGASAAPLAERHGSAVAPLAVSAWTAGAWALVGLGLPAAGVAVAAGSSAALVPKLRGLEHPWHETARLAGLGHLHGGRAIADAVRRPWWPIAAAAAVVSRRARRAVLAAATIPLLVEWWRERPGLDPARWVAVRLADDVAYGAGVWAGCWRERSLGALLPDLSSWPGRADAVEPGTAAPGSPRSGGAQL
jgi:mycofactocin system glycosyltransferase